LDGQARPGAAGKGAARIGEARQARHGEARLRWAPGGMARQARQGSAGNGSKRLG